MLLYLFGGDGNKSLLKAVGENPYLEQLIREAEFYFGASAGVHDRRRKSP